MFLYHISFDGMWEGLDLDIIKSISENSFILVIASGGCGLAQHFADGFLKGKADAVAVGSFFAHRDQNFMQTRSQIKNAGINIRMHH